jgi:hypothetical protein
VQKYSLAQTREKLTKIFEQLYPLQEPTEEQQLQYPEKVAIRPPPYEEGEWRQVGVTAEMVKAYCKEDNIAVHILYSDRLIQSCYPDGWVPGKHNACVCFNIWSDHGFFYDGSTKEGHTVKQSIARMRPLAPAEEPGVKLHQPSEDDDRLNYDEMIPYTAEAFARALQIGKVTSFYVTESLQEVVEYAHQQKLSYRRYYGKNPAVPSSISVYLKTSQPNKKEEAVAGQKSQRTKDALKVKVLPKEHKRLKLVADAFFELTGLKLQYKGEPHASLMDKMLQQLLVTKRKRPALQTRP